MRRALQILFPVSGLLILLFVWSVAVGDNGGLQATFAPASLDSLLFNLFRLAGLTTFTLVSFQILTGPYMKFWEKLYGAGFYKFHAYEGLVALTFATLHPLLLYTSLFIAGISPFVFAKNYPIQYYFGPLAWLCLVVTVTTAAMTILWNKPKFAKVWHWFHLLNYAVFLLGFFHSIIVGADVAPTTSQLRPLWWLFFVGMIVGLLYRRILRVFQDHSHGLNN